MATCATTFHTWWTTKMLRKICFSVFTDKILPYHVTGNSSCWWKPNAKLTRRWGLFLQYNTSVTMMHQLWTQPHFGKLRVKNIKDENYQEKEDTSSIMSAITSLPPCEKRLMHTYKIMLLTDRTPNKSTQQDIPYWTPANSILKKKKIQSKELSENWKKKKSYL